MASAAARELPPGREQKAMIDAIAQHCARRVAHRHRRTLCPRLRARRGVAENDAAHPEQRLITSLFLGTMLSITSVKIVALVVREVPRSP